MFKKLLKWFLKNPDEFDEKKEELDKMIDEISNHYADNPNVKNSNDRNMEYSENGIHEVLNESSNETGETLNALSELADRCGKTYSFRLLCRTTSKKTIDHFCPDDGLFAPYSVYESITKFFREHGITKYNIEIDKPVFVTANDLKNQIKHKDKHGVFDVNTRVIMRDEYPQIDFGILVSMAVPVYPFKQEETSHYNWLVIDLITSIDVSYTPETGKPIESKELTEFFVEVCKAIIKTASESQVAKDLQYKLPNVLPEKIVDLPFNRSEREVTIYSRYTSVDEAVGNFF